MEASPAATQNLDAAKIEELKTRMQTLAQSGQYEQAEKTKRTLVIEIKRQRESAIRALLEETEAVEKRTNDTANAEIQDLDATCRATIAQLVRKYKKQVEAAKTNFKSQRADEVQRAQALINAGARVSPKYLEVKEIEKIKAREGDFHGARAQQVLANKVKAGDTARFEQATKDELARKIYEFT